MIGPHNLLPSLLAMFGWKSSAIRTAPPPKPENWRSMGHYGDFGLRGEGCPKSEIPSPISPRSRGRQTQEPIEQICRDPLDARVCDGGVIQSPAPADRPCSENPGTTRCLVNRRV